MSERSDVIAGLREAAHFLEQHPEIRIQSGGNTLDLRIWAHDAKEMAEAARSLGQADKDYAQSYAKVERTIGGVARIGAIALRDKVCERVVIGTETVKTEVEIEPAKTEVQTVEREKVEWRCEPLLKAVS